MSKLIKQMEMDSLKSTFKDVRDAVLLTASGISAQQDHQLRHTLRKKQIRFQLVKNSLMRKVLGELDIQLQDCWAGPTFLAWGGSSVSELSRELDGLIKKNDKIKVKTAIADGQEVTFKQALAMPTRQEAIARVIGLALSPANRLAGQILAPAGNIAGQIKTLTERTAETPAEAAAEAPPA